MHTDELAFGQCVEFFMAEHDIQNTLKQFVSSCLSHSRELRFVGFRHNRNAQLNAVCTTPLKMPRALAGQKPCKINTELCALCTCKLKPVPWKLKQQPGNCCYTCTQTPGKCTLLVLEASKLQSKLYVCNASCMLKVIPQSYHAGKPPLQKRVT